MLAFSALSAASPPSLPADPPFRTYSVTDGLNQKAAHAIVQDARGFLWVASYGGLNRFDGSTFKSFTTRQGLRNNFVTALFIDHLDRLWAGDAEGGLTVIENGKVTLTINPPKDKPGTIRSMVALGDHLYMGTEPGSLRRVSMSSPTKGVEYLADMQREVENVVVAGDSELFLLSDENLYRFNPAEDEAPLRAAANITLLAGNQVAGIYVGNAEGFVGRWQEDKPIWLPENYGAPVRALSFINDWPGWVSTQNHLMPFGNPSEKAEIFDQIDSLVDAEGVLWLTQSTGLSRHLGNDIRHFSLTTDKGSPSVFSIQPDEENGYWFGTGNGLIRAYENGVLNEMSATQSMPVSEVRSLKLTKDGRTLWASHIKDKVYRVDTRTLEATPVFPEKNSVIVGLELDTAGRVWAGAYDGSLYTHDPVTGKTKKRDLGSGASIYSLSMGANGWLWFTVNYAGVYRINTLDSNALPELMISTDQLGKGLFTHLLAKSTPSGATELWFTTANGGVFHWSNGELNKVIDDPFLSDQTIYAIAHLNDNTLVLSSNKGAYRFDLATKTLQRFGPLNGFTGIEGKAHAMFLEADSTLWIGTGSGVSAMDVSRPMSPIPDPRSFITRISIDDQLLQANAAGITEIGRGNIVVEFASISTRAPDGLEYSYVLSGFDADWSVATTNTSVGYSHLPPGTYEFQVRSRRPGGAWGEADHWSFLIPTPFWQTPWFILIAAGACLLLVKGAVELRLRAIAKLNERLREEVAERTQSIEAGRVELLRINSQLTKEVDERRRSDALRADVEARFHQAYQNAPIGMALVHKDGTVYDANPVLKSLFWPQSKTVDKEPLIDVIAETDRRKFEAFLVNFWSNELDTPSMEFECIAHSGGKRRIDFLPSAVRDDSGALQYIVLLANDVTESHAMTRQLKYQASFDELTGLLNRRAYAHRLESASAESANDAFLLLLDLDQFKVVNDTCGHAAGDELLRKAANIITGGVRQTDTVARLGGDEFAVILTKCNQDMALERAESIRRAIQNIEFFWESETFRIGVSIGVVAIEKSTDSLAELQQLADAACYAAKDAGRNRVHFITSKQDAAYEHRGEMRWVQRLNHAIDTNGFVLYGQKIHPLVANMHPDTSPGEAEKRAHQPERIEVLIRMRDRKANRLIPPNAFLPAAERYGLHDKLDRWVVKQVVGFITGQKSGEHGKQQFWVNLSGASVSDKNFSDELIQLVADSKVPTGSLNFEITETAAIRKIEDAARLVSSLQGMGCRFALDDFGSGLSSFGYLKKLGVDCLKIDGEFIKNITDDPTDPIFVKSIIDIAHAMDMEVVTEFVEDEEILHRVTELGADYAQGFGVHRPEPLDQLVNLLVPKANAKG